MSAIRIDIERVVVDAGVDARGVGEAVRAALAQQGAPPAVSSAGVPQAVAAAIGRALRGGAK